MDSIIVRFAVDPQTLEVINVPWPPAEVVKTWHIRLLENWLRHGRLIYGTSDDLNRLEDTVRGLPQSLNKRWQVAWKQLRMDSAKGRWKSLKDVFETKDLEDLGTHLELACFDREKAEAYLGLTDSQQSRFPLGPDLEICAFDAIDQSKAFMEAKRLATVPVDRGSSVDALWIERLAPLESIYRNVTLLDAYAVNRHLDRQAGLEQSGLQRLIKELNWGSCEHNLSVYCATGGNSNLPSTTSSERALRNIVSGLTIRKLKKLTLWTAPAQHFTKPVHYRFLRFGSVYCSLNTGIDVLKGTRVERTCEFTLLYDHAQFKKEEKEIRSHGIETVIPLT